MIYLDFRTQYEAIVRPTADGWPLKPGGAITAFQGVDRDINSSYFWFMKHLSILVPEGAMLGAVEGPLKLFTEVNGLLVNMGREPLFTIQLVGLTHETKLNNGLFTVHPELTVKDKVKTDLVISPRCIW